MLKRDLTSRHMTMIAVGGCIGTGLFLASGATIATAGPGGALLSYAFIGIMVYFLMTSLGELAVYLPVAGSFSTYGARYVDEAFGFALGWNYWFNWAVTVAVELVAAQVILAYWVDMSGSYSWVWTALLLGFIFLLNFVSVKGFGEGEFWFALIKVVVIISFIIVGLLMIFGILRGGPHSGWQNWTMGDAPFVGGFSSIVGVAMIVGFSFQGTELVGVTAGESSTPEKTIPKAVRQVFWRILLFYILSIFVISTLIPYTDPHLLNDNVKDIGRSPFTLVFENAGLLFAASLMNAVILTSLLSSGNSGLYAASRMLYSLSLEGKAPKFFSRLSRSGIPRNALYVTTAIAMLCFLSSIFGYKKFYLWLLNLSGMSGFIAWLGIALSHYRFRKGMMYQGIDTYKALPYRAKFFPFAPVFAFVLCMTITLGQNYEAFMGDTIDWNGVFATYIGLPVFLLVLLGYKIIKKTKYVRYKDMDFSRQAVITQARKN